MNIRVWLNNCSVMDYHIIKLLRNNPDGVEFIIYGTCENKHFPYLKSCDYSEIESSLIGEEYIEYCLEFCKKHRIDVFIPHKNLLYISEHVKSFEDIGTKVLLGGDNETIRKITNRAELYDLCKKNNIVSLPDYHIVNSAEQFMASYRNLQEKGCRVCIKPACAEGDSGFRIIDDKADTIQKLFGVITPSVSSEKVYRILSGAGEFKDLIVFEYLTGYEYNLDCLGYKGKLLSVMPVKKVDGRVRSLEKNLELMSIAQKITDFFSLSYAFSINVKFSNNIPELVEINPGMSSEIHISSLCGINFPYTAVRLLLDGQADIQEPEFDITVTQIETELVFKTG